MRQILFTLLLRPELIALHLQGYADLLHEESARLKRHIRHRVLVCALGVCSLLLAGLWAGIALLLWSALPSVAPRWAWVLWAWPLAWLLVAVACWVVSRQMRGMGLFPRTRAQIELDLLALRQAAKA